MKTNIEDWDESFLDLESAVKAMEGLGLK